MKIFLKITNFMNKLKFNDLKKKACSLQVRQAFTPECAQYSIHKYSKLN